MKANMNESGLDSRLGIIHRAYEKLPFNQVLGFKVSYLRTDGAGLNFLMRDELIGNAIQGILHGGVISAVLDTTGGLTATASAMERMHGLSFDKTLERISRIGTIDMRIDYLRPGRGTRFFSTGTIMRTGRKLAVTRMELKNQDDLLIAVGTASYIIS